MFFSHLSGSPRGTEAQGICLHPAQEVLCCIKLLKAELSCRPYFVGFDKSAVANPSLDSNIVNEHPCSVNWCESTPSHMRYIYNTRSRPSTFTCLSNKLTPCFSGISANGWNPYAMSLTSMSHPSRSSFSPPGCSCGFLPSLSRRPL